jgi:hypothetical protein
MVGVRHHTSKTKTAEVRDAVHHSWRRYLRSDERCHRRINLRDARSVWLPTSRLTFELFEPYGVYSSKLKLQSELEATAIIQRIGDLAESRGTQVRVRIGELRSVEEIDRFDTERGLPLRA